MTKTKTPKTYIITTTKCGLYSTKERKYITEPLTLEEAIKYFSYTLEVGQSWEKERGNKKINREPKSMKSLMVQLYNASNNAASNGYSGYSYEFTETTSEEIKTLEL